MKLEDISQMYMKLSVRESDTGFIAPVLRPASALRYLADCFDANFKLLGMSGFHYFDSGAIQPDQIFEVDARDFDSEEEFFDRVGGLILSQMRSDVVFEIAFEENPLQSPNHI